MRPRERGTRPRARNIGADPATRYLEQSKAENTRRVPLSWADFTAWCVQVQPRILPALPDTVAYYLADRSQDLKTSTLQRRACDNHRSAPGRWPRIARTNPRKVRDCVGGESATQGASLKESQEARGSHEARSGDGRQIANGPFGVRRPIRLHSAPVRRRDAADE